MAYQELTQRLRPLCPEVEEQFIRDILSRMEPDYFERFRAREVADHVRLAARLNPKHPCQISITESEHQHLDIVVVAYDYFSEFAAICGLLSAYGLDIWEGSVYTTMSPLPSPLVSRRSMFRPSRQSPQKRSPARKVIIDHFLVQPWAGAPFTDGDRRRFVEELDRMVRLLDSGRYEEVRVHVNRRLVETLGKFERRFAGLLQPIEIQFENDPSSLDTVMEILSVDTPAFLYAFSNTLVMRGVYIHKAKFENTNGKVCDRFHVRGKDGHKIEARAEQEELKVTATFIKQFTHYLTLAPDPAKAIEHFDQFLDRVRRASRHGSALEFLKKKSTLTLLARLLGTSDFLWEDFLRREYANLLPIAETYMQVPLRRPRADMLRELRRRVSRARTDDERKSALNQFKDREMFRIDMRHLMDPASTLPNFSEALTVLAEIVLEGAARECQAKLSRLHGSPRLKGRRPCPFAVFGLGKFGGRELGYASDLEALFVYGQDGRTGGRRPVEHSDYFERLVQSILEWIDAKQEGIFQLDLRLRPHGRMGPLAISLEALRAYYSASGSSAPFERQAMIKLRFVAGHQALGRQVEAHRDSFVYSERPWDLATALHLRERQTKELVEPGQTSVKHSPGGLIDIEYTVQYLQLMHGHADARLRTPTTLRALAALGQTGILKPADVTALREAYLFLRKLIDALRIVRGHAKDLVLPPPHSDESLFLARRLGYATEDWREGEGKLQFDISRYMATTSSFFERQFRRQ